MMELCDRLHCTGCEACRSVCPLGCISMEEDAEGFLHPVIDPVRCVGCGLCRKTCPVLGEVPLAAPGTVYAAWSLDEAGRTGSSSGGVFYELARQVVGEGGVVCGAVREGGRVLHRCTDTLSGVEAMRGSKYVQSRIGDCYREVSASLEQGRKVLFSGTPCQVAGLRAFLDGKDYPGLVLVDLVCHGVPSARLFGAYREGLVRRYGEREADSYRFRRGDRWSLSADIGTGDGRRLLPVRDSAFLTLYLDGVLFRESCYRCPFARTERTGDLTLGDFWGVGETVPFDGDPSRGCSLVMVGSARGSALLAAIRSRLFLRERSLEEALGHNANLSAPSVRPACRGKIYRRIFRYGFRPEQLRSLMGRFFKERYARLHHQFHLLKTRLCRKSA